jgi:hypothetical protein
LNQALTALAKVPGRAPWNDEAAIHDDLINVYVKQQKDPQPIYVRKLAAMTERGDRLPGFRSPEHALYVYDWVEAAGKVADLYLRQNKKAEARAAYAQVFYGTVFPTMNRDAKKLDVMLTNLEKYQSLLRENKEDEKAASFDDTVRHGRSRQHELENTQQDGPPNQ